MQPGLAAPPLPQASDPRWGTFRARGAACGLPILAFDCVCDEAVDTAEGVLARMLEGAPQHVLAALAAGGAQVAIIGKDQVHARAGCLLLASASAHAPGVLLHPCVQPPPQRVTRRPRPALPPSPAPPGDD